jgi:glycosyltransferase involved in cell wall biosynthesis
LVADAPVGAARKELGIPEGMPIILSVGRLEPEKGFDELISTFAASGLEAWLVIVGEGVLRESLEGLARELNVSGRVILAGKKTRREIWSYYKDAGAFVLLSRSEGLGLVFWEAMHVGTPVIGRPVGGIQETIGSDGGRGFFWDTPEGPAAFKEKLTRCFEKGDGVRAMTARARLYVADRIGLTSSV